MSSAKKHAGGGGAKAAAALRGAAATRGAPVSRSLSSSAATSSLASRSRSRPSVPLASCDDADDGSSNDDEHDEDAEEPDGSDDRTPSSSDDERGGRRGGGGGRRPAEASSQSDSDDDPLEPKLIGGVSVAAVESGLVSPPVRAPPASSGKKAARAALPPALSDSEALSLILEANGLTREDHQRNPAPKDGYLEVFQINKFRRIQGFNSFGATIRHLEIMHQNIVVIEGLQALVNLEILYLNNNCITRISGLESNARLTELYLGENAIARLEGLSGLRSLRVLSLYDNQIPLLEGLDSLTDLRTLNLARNRLTEVGSALDHLSALTSLNLADNQLSSFTQIRHLARLKSLHTLYLSDPHHGDNPLCSQCNYHTYALYRLGHLSVLDSIRVSEDSRALAEATFIKKTMYYNMKIKSAKSCTSNVIKRGHDMLRTRVEAMDGLRTLMQKQWRATKAEMDGAGDDGGAAADPRDRLSAAALASRLQSLESMLLSLSARVSAASSFASSFSRRLSSLSETLISRMQTELESGGNVRFEDGALGSDPWALSCVHYLHTHLCSPALAKRFGLGDTPQLRVRRITKIHNRMLRNRFDDAVEKKQEADAAAGNKTRADVQYAFVANWGSSGTQQAAAANAAAADGQTSDATSAALHAAAHDGFARPASASSAPALLLSNSVLYSDLPRLSALHRQSPALFRSDVSSLSSRPSLKFVPGGELLLAKVYLGSCSQRSALGASAGGTLSSDPLSAASLPPTFRQQDFPAFDSVAEEFAGEPLGTSPAAAANADSASASKASAAAAAINNLGSPAGKSRSVERDEEDEAATGGSADSAAAAPPTETKLRRIHLFDRALALPEYIVSFDYVLGGVNGGSSSGSLSAEELSSAMLYGAPLELDPELTRLAGNFVGLREPIVDLTTLLRGWDRADAEIKSTLSALPKILPRADLLPALASGGRSLNGLRSLNLSDLHLKTIPAGAFDALGSTLQTLLLNFNAFAKLDGLGLDRLPQLTRLELAHNSLRKLSSDVLSHLPALAHLDLSSNLLASFRSDFMGIIATEARRLTHLDLRGNATLIAKAGGTYHAQILAALPSLNTLDLIDVSACSPDAFKGKSAAAAASVGEISEAAILAARRHPLSLFNGSFASSSEGKDSKEETSVSSSSTRGKSGAAPSPRSSPGPSAGAGISEELLLQQSLIDRDAAAKRAKEGSSASSSSTAVVPSSRSRSVYTRVRLADFLSELSSASSPAAAPNAASAIPAHFFDEILEVELDHQRLTSLVSPVLSRCVNLRKLSLADNALSRIEGLDSLLKLEELSLEENRLSKLEGLCQLKCLSKLDLGRNKLESINVAESLCGLESSLTQLSLEDNAIKSIAGFEALTGLMELYLGNNRIETVKDLVSPLKDLPRLLILDASGTPASSLPEYRLSVVFSLRKLKVLDGVAIDSAELSLARESYAGRLTEDLLVSLLGHSFFGHVENLDLSASKLRSVDLITAQRFGNIRVLVMDNNQISDLSSLSPLALLRVLRLNKNRIVSIPCSDANTHPTKQSSSGPPSAGVGLLPRCFPHLEVLELGFNRIASIAALNLRGLNELRVLTLESNEITRMDGLQGLPNLQQLVLAKNKIQRFEPRGASFAGLSELRGLQLEENGLRSLAGVCPLPKLKSIFLAYNRLSDLSELESLSSLSPVLSEVTLRNNPLARKNLYRPTVIRRAPPSLLTLDGKEVTFEERERAEAIFSNAAPAGGSIGPNGEPLVSAGGGMPGAVYFYSDVPRPNAGGGAGGAQQPGPDKVPLQPKSFSLGAFMPEPVSSYGAHPSSQFHQSGLGLGLGVGGVSVGSAAHMSLNLGHNMQMQNRAAAGVGGSGLQGSGQLMGGPSTLQQQLAHVQAGGMLGYGGGKLMSPAAAAGKQRSGSSQPRR